MILRKSRPSKNQAFPSAPLHSAAPTLQQTSAASNPMPIAPTKKSKKPTLVSIAIVLLAVILCAEVAAAAYLKVYLPNTPENKLLASFTNLATQPSMTISGTADSVAKEANRPQESVAVNYKLGVDLHNSNFALSGTFGMSGVQIPFESRYLDKDLYLKVGGLDFVKKLIPPELSADPKLGPYFDSLKELNDQWYVVDRSFMSNAGASCIADLSLALNDDDGEKIHAAYEKYPLFKIKNTSDQTIDNVDVTKYELEPSDDKTAENFVNELSDISAAKKIRDCIKDTGAQDTIADNFGDKENSKDDNDDEATGTFFAYVTKDKQLKQVELEAKDKDSTTKLVAKFDYAPVTIEKPESAKPIQELLGDLFGGAL